ncbi:hypothetical protein ACEWFD_04250, partial [Klebsiella pneumoniae]
VGKTLLHGDVLMWLMKTLLTSRCINQRGAGQAGYNTDWIEKCLAHEQKGVRAVYNKAEYREQRAEMLQDWANMIDEWVSN